MRCPQCNCADTEVLRSLPRTIRIRRRSTDADEQRTVRFRRRACRRCGTRFTTREEAVGPPQPPEPTPEERRARTAA